MFEKQKIFVGLLLVLTMILFLSSEPYGFPVALDVGLVIGFLILYFVLIVILLTEKSKDERDEFHILRAGRISFMVGTVIMSVGITKQVLMHKVDSWLVLTFVAIILTQFFSRIYLHFKK